MGYFHHLWGLFSTFEFECNIIMQLKLIEFEELNSTNDYARSLIEAGQAEEGSVVCTDNQTQGKGQADSIWESQKGKNLLCSLILKPSFFPAEKYFYISMITALGIADCLSSYLKIEEVKIKWPNDIYIKSEKVAGILIQNDLNQYGISSSIIGIGLNVNQLQFSENLPNPISLAQILGREVELKILRVKVLEAIIIQYQNLMAGEYVQIKAKYEKQLYRFNTKAYYKSEGQVKFEAIISGVDEFGKLLLKTDEELKAFDMKELAYIF